MARAWVFQVRSQVEKHGSDKASWYVGWVDPAGNRKSKSCGSGKRGKRDAERLADLIHSKLVSGTYDVPDETTWRQFRELYDRDILPNTGAESATEAKKALDRFDRIARPGKVAAITRQHIDRFIAERKRHKGRMSATIAPATVNKDLRYIKAALRVAVDWEMLEKLPRIRMLDEPDSLPTFVTAEHFAAIYQACDTARLPQGIPNVTAPEWWRALLVTAYLTGWRVNQVLSLRTADVDLEQGTAVSRASDAGNKGGRDTLVHLHPVAVEHLRAVQSFGSVMLPWPHHERTLWTQFVRIQKAAGIPKGVGREGWYGFHDLRRGFATNNAEHLDLFELQALMQHRSLDTTRIYANMAKKARTAVDRLYIPDVLKPGRGSCRTDVERTEKTARTKRRKVE